MAPMCVIPSDNAATDILGLVKRRIIIAVKGGGVNLKKIHIIFCTFKDNLFGKNKSKSGGVLIAKPVARNVIMIVVITRFRRGSL